MKTSIPKLHSIKWKNGALADNVEPLPNIQPHDIPVDNVLKGAWEANLKDVVLLGITEEGCEYIASATCKTERAAYMFSRGQLFMLRQADA